MTGVAVNWVDDSFTSLRVTVPEGGMYRISYWAVNKSNTTEQEVVTTGSSSQVIKGFSPDYFYTIVVEDQDVFMKTGKGSAGIGEYYLNMSHDIYLDLNYFIPIVFYRAGIGITVAVAAAVILLLLGLCCSWLVR